MLKMSQRAWKLVKKVLKHHFRIMSDTFYREGIMYTVKGSLFFPFLAFCVPRSLDDVGSTLRCSLFESWERNDLPDSFCRSCHQHWIFLIQRQFTTDKVWPKKHLQKVMSGAFSYMVKRWRRNFESALSPSTTHTHPLQNKKKLTSSTRCKSSWNRWKSHRSLGTQFVSTWSGVLLYPKRILRLRSSCFSWEKRLKCCLSFTRWTDCTAHVRTVIQKLTDSPNSSLVELT